MQRSWVSSAIAAAAVALVGNLGVAHADANKVEFDLEPASAVIASCLPNAAAHVTVELKEAQRGTDTLKLNARGLSANTTFAVFLTQNSAFDSPPFGAVQYIGDFTTNNNGDGHLKVEAIIEEAFSSAVCPGPVRVRQELNNVVFWFADPAAADPCFAPGTGPITPFDGDGDAGAAAMSSTRGPIP